ncbi:MAG TPA: GNAT family N-acetyltransferase [Lacunisphaera sp.]
MSAITSRVSLRPIETGDLETFFLHQLDPEAVRMVGFRSRDRAAFFAHWTNNVLGNATATNRTILYDQSIAGNIGTWTDATTQERLIGYWLGREFWGRGVASAAVRQFLEAELTRPLTARVVPHNRGSIRVLEKTGFVRKGEESLTLPDGSLHEEFVYVLSAKNS